MPIPFSAFAFAFSAHLGTYSTTRNLETALDRNRRETSVPLYETEPWSLSPLLDNLLKLAGTVQSSVSNHNLAIRG